MIEIKITMDPTTENALLSCTVTKFGALPTSQDLFTAIGMLQTATMAMLAGRWGVMDEQRKKARCFPPMGTDYKQKPPRKAKK